MLRRAQHEGLVLSLSDTKSTPLGVKDEAFQMSGGMKSNWLRGAGGRLRADCVSQSAPGT